MLVLSVAAFSPVIPIQNVQAQMEIYVPDNYPTIQDAIKAASSGDTIIVRDGTYTENVVVIKSLTIRSENGPGSTIINGASVDATVFDVRKPHVTIWGFTITGLGSKCKGIDLTGKHHCTIFNNNLLNNSYGIYLDTKYCNNNTITYNNFSNNGVGIDFRSASNHNFITKNIILNNYDDGIRLYSSNYNTITKNDFLGNGDGIDFRSSSNNILYLNNFRNNNYNIHTTDSTNIWDSSQKIIYRYNETAYESYMGNYLVDYSGLDANGNGIGDSPYGINSNADNYPLMKPWRIYFPVHNLNIDENFGTIQVGIINARSGDTIIVRDGIYTENVKVDRCLTMRSENGSESTIVQAANPDEHVFNVTADADHLKISDFTIKGATNAAGISLSEACYCDISNNIALNNGGGIYLNESEGNTIKGNDVSNNDCGILLDHSSSNTITNNNASNNEGGIGILLGYSSSNTITNNIALNNGNGISLAMSNSNIITNNTASSNDYGFYLDHHSTSNTLSNNIANLNTKEGIYLNSSSNSNTIKSNTALENKGSGIYLDSSSTNNNIESTLANSNTKSGIYIKSSNNTIKRNTVLENKGSGIYLDYAHDNTIESNTASNNDNGIYLFGSNKNTIKSNTANSNKWQGISINYASENNMESNNVRSNSEYGILLYGSSKNTLCNNIFVDDGFFVHDSYQNTVQHNIVNSRLLVYLENKSDQAITNINVGQVILVNCSNIKIENLNLSNASVGVELWKTKNSKIINNIAANNNFGIYLQRSSNNNIYLNNFINNIEDNVRSVESTNVWSSPEKINYTYTETTYTNYLGNYWDDFEGSDANNDGIGDTPYIIDSDKDSFPLMKSVENYL